MKSCPKIIFTVFVFILLVIDGRAQAASSLSVTDRDRILILAPHPDDEAIGTGGVIQKAVALGVQLKIVYLTNGDNNELSFLVYKKRPVLGRKGLLKMGQVRRDEAINAMTSLGVKDSQQIFLGYPDSGCFKIFTKYWGDEKPLKSMLTRVRSVPYMNAFSYKAPYKGESILNDLKKILLDFKPTKIFVTLPVDSNGDHQAYYLFLQVALWDLSKKIPAPEINPFVVHIARWPLPRGFHPELTLDVPKILENAVVDWRTLDLSPEEIDKKKSAIDCYKSQNAYNKKYLPTFARKNELFGDYHDIIVPESDRALDWDQYIRDQNLTPHLEREGKSRRNVIESVAFARQDEKLLIRLTVNRVESEFARINLFLLGYKNGTNFSNMPKIRINIGFDRFISAFNKLDPVFIEGLKFSHKNDILLLEIPLASLGHPDKILSSIRTNIADWPIEATAWRTFIVSPHGKTN